MNHLLRNLIVMACSMLLLACTGQTPDTSATKQLDKPAPPNSIDRPVVIKSERPSDPHKENNHMVPAKPDTSVPADVLDMLLEQVATLSAMSKAQIITVRAESVTWRDGSLGCPQPNMAYTQALVDGYWVILRAGREEFDYRVGKNRKYMRCQGSTKQAPIRFEDS